MDAPVYVLDPAQEDGHIGAPPGDEGDRFFISCRSEEQPEEKYGRDALLLGLVVLGLFVFGAIFVAATGAF